MAPPYRPVNASSPGNSSESSPETHVDEDREETSSNDETGKEESEEEEQVPAGLVLRAFSRPTLAVSETGKCLSIALKLFYRCTSGRQVHACNSSRMEMTFVLSQLQFADRCLDVSEARGCSLRVAVTLCLLIA